jgi:alkylation response protein AidB-like acyl-CoA dehydrogenase
MNFSFSEDQLLFRDSVKDFLTNEVTADTIRESWKSETGRSDALWSQFAELGLTSMLVEEAHGGLGMNEEDFILIGEECGRVALHEPLVENAMVALPLLQDSNNDAIKKYWLGKIISGEAKLAVGHPINPLVSDAHIADLLLLANQGEVHAVEKSQVTLIAQESVDPSRKLFKVEWKPSADTCIASGEQAIKLWRDTLNRGALAVAAQHLGLAQQMVSMCVEYSSERKQFGKAIGTFQALKHHMANVAVKYEFSKAVIYRAANSIVTQHPNTSTHVAHAKIAASEAALLAAKNAIQLHGAMGYTWEVNLHIWMKRAWALDNSWGTVGYHKKQIAEYAFSDTEELGASNSF